MVSEPFRQTGVQIDQNEQLMMQFARLIAEVQGPSPDDPRFETLFLLPYVICAVMKKQSLPFKPEDTIYEMLDLINPAYRHGFQDIVPQPSAPHVGALQISDEDRDAYLRAQQAVESRGEQSRERAAALAAQLRDVGSLPNMSSFTRSEFMQIAVKFTDPALSDEAVLDRVRADFEEAIRYQFGAVAQYDLFSKNQALWRNQDMLTRVLNMHMDTLATSIEEESVRIYDNRPVDEADLLRRMREYDASVRQADLRDQGVDPKLP